MLLQKVQQKLVLLSLRVNDSTEEEKLWIFEFYSSILVRCLCSQRLLKYEIPWKANENLNKILREFNRKLCQT